MYNPWISVGPDLTAMLMRLRLRVSRLIGRFEIGRVVTQHCSIIWVTQAICDVPQVFRQASFRVRIVVV